MYDTCSRYWSLPTASLVLWKLWVAGYARTFGWKSVNPADGRAGVKVLSQPLHLV